VTGVTWRALAGGFWLSKSNELATLRAMAGRDFFARGWRFPCDRVARVIPRLLLISH